VLFDLDGVLTPTARIHAEAWTELFDGFLKERDGDGFRPFTASDYEEYVDGKPRADGTRDFLRSRGIDLPEGDPDDPPGSDTVAALAARKDALFLAKVSDGVEAYPGSVRYLRAVRAAGLATAVVSASRNCAQIVHAAGLDDLLDVRVDGVVAADEGLRGKPHPDTFLAAARRLGADPVTAAVFEDALAGVQAGRDGRFGYVVGVDRVDEGVAHAHADGLRAHGASIVVRDLAELIGTPPAGPARGMDDPPGGSRTAGSADGATPAGGAA